MDSQESLAESAALTNEKKELVRKNGTAIPKKSTVGEGT